MITALISVLVGLLAGCTPLLLSEWAASRQQRRCVAVCAGKSNETHQVGLSGPSNAVALNPPAPRPPSRVEAPIGVGVGHTFVGKWNSVLRPLTTTVILLVFVGLVCIYVYTLMCTGVGSETDALFDLINNSIVGDSIQAVLGFIYGYRSARK